jgi:hypothetical protein
MDKDEATKYHKRLANFTEELLIKHDPVKLYDEETDNRDEYAPEAEDIIKVLPRCRTLDELRHAIWEIFRNSFSERTAGAELKYHEIAEDLWLHVKVPRK